jgi:methionyl-tRNA formyltransferase
VKIAIIGRTEILYDTALLLNEKGHDISLIVTAKEAPEYTKTSSDFEALAETWGIPFLATPKIEDACNLIKSVEDLDIAVSINFSGIIPEHVTKLFPLGILNAHGGDLPRYRGNACQAWAILNGEDKIGLCIHKMVGGELDSGDIISREYFPLNLSTKVTEVYKWMNDRIPFMFLESLDKFKTDPAYVLEKQSKDLQDSLRCYPRKPEDGKIDWNKSAEEILRLINATNKPYTGAFCNYEGENLIIWDAEIALEENFLAIPGQVTLINEDFIEVATGDGKLRINSIEIAGKIINPSMLIGSIRKRLS